MLAAVEGRDQPGEERLEIAAVVRGTRALEPAYEVRHRPQFWVGRAADADLQVMAAVRIADRRQDVGAGLGIYEGRHPDELGQQPVIDMRQDHGSAEYPQLQVDRQEAAGIGEGARGDQHSLGPQGAAAAGVDLDAACGWAQRSRLVSNDYGALLPGNFGLCADQGPRTDVAGAAALEEALGAVRHGQERKPGGDAGGVEPRDVGAEHPSHCLAAVEVIGAGGADPEIAGIGEKPDAAAGLDFGVAVDRALRRHRPGRVPVNYARDAALVVMAGKYAGVRGAVGRLVRAEDNHAVGQCRQVPAGGAANQSAADDDDPVHVVAS